MFNNNTKVNIFFVKQEKRGKYFILIQKYPLFKRPFSVKLPFLLKNLPMLWVLKPVSFLYSKIMHYICFR